MRTLPRYMIMSYIGPFLMTFFIAVFVLFMQFVWKYVDDLIGKGLETTTLAELFFFAALQTFPLALPLAILLSSLMTFGNLGEQFELVAIKSSGISLQRMMSPLAMVALLTSIGAFIFSNNVLPYVNLKTNSLIYDIQQKRPALNIKEKVFYNGIEGYTIRIDEKESDEITCHGIMIYDHSQGVGNNKVITAQSGTMQQTADKQFLAVDLFNGTSYEEMSDPKSQSRYPLTRSTFKEQTVLFDLSGFRMVRTDEELFKSNYSMLNISQLEKMTDSMQTARETKVKEFKKNFSDMLSENNIAKEATVVGDSSRSILPALIALPSADGENARVVDMAMNLARSKKYYVESLISEMENYDRPIIVLKVEWHKKFTFSLACLILFFVGAPLGAIIRKGGLGMPVVVSVIIFILFWVISITGEKMSKEGAISPHIGMWIATAITLPIGIFLTSKATSDSALFDTESYFNLFKNFSRRKK